MRDVGVSPGTARTQLQVFQAYLFEGIDEAANQLDPQTLDALRQSVVMRMDRVADTALWD